MRPQQQQQQQEDQHQQVTNLSRRFYFRSWEMMMDHQQGAAASNDAVAVVASTTLTFHPSTCSHAATIAIAIANVECIRTRNNGHNNNVEEEEMRMSHSRSVFHCSRPKRTRRSDLSCLVCLGTRITIRYVAMRYEQVKTGLTHTKKEDRMTICHAMPCHAAWIQW